MSAPIRVLLAEDQRTEAELELRELKRAGLILASRVVDTEAQFREALQQFSPDVILSDFSMPHFDGMSALAIARELAPQVPFIFVSGTIGEEVAVQAMKAGADDYVMKTNLMRLGPAVERALRETAKLKLEIGERKRAEQAVRDSEAKYRGLVEQASDGIFITDEGGNFLFANSRYREMLGYAEDELIGLNVAVTYPEAERAAVRQRVAELRQTGGRLLERMIRRKDGSSFPVEINIRFLANGTHQGIVRDVSDRKRAEEHLRRLNRVYAVLSGINTLIVRVRDRAELFAEACRIAVEEGQFRLAWIGLVDQAAGVVRPVASAGDVRDFFDAAPLAVMENKPGAHGLAGRAVRAKKPIISNDVHSDPQRLMRKELKERGINSLAVMPLMVGNEVMGVLCLYAADVGFFDDAEMKLLLELAGDISFAIDHIDKAEKIDYLAYYDGMTGLANRKLFDERLRQYVKDAGREQRRIGLAVLDIERFKTINDTFGRQAGDQVLTEVAGRMKRAAIEDERMARVGADHFAVVVADVQSDEDLARRLEKALHEFFGAPFSIGESELRIAGRAGIALFPNDATDAEALFRNAEAALKNAKERGERYLFYEQQMTQRVAERLALENELRQAIEKEEFVLFYQPKVDGASGRIVAVEALIRWQSPERGLVPPMHFIPLLEETGLILQVGSWALRRAALDHRAWVEEKLPAPRVAVNLSAVQVRQRDFVNTVERAIVDGVAPTAIDLEITESLAMEDIQRNIEKLKAVRALGMQIAVDDFGTGHSSLGYLAQLPVQSLKIDRSFVAKMQEDPNAMTLVSTIISLAHSLRLSVIAEGVETEEQAKFLRLLRCDQMQGYLFSKPVPKEALDALLRGAPVAAPAA